MSASRKRQNAFHLPGKTFSAEEEEYIIDLKETQDPPLDWTTLTNRFNLKFPESTRSKGGLQVHYSRSLQPGSRRRPSNRVSHRFAALTNSARAQEKRTAPTSDADTSDTEDANFPDQFANSSTDAKHNSGAYSQSTIKATENPLQSSPPSLTQQASPRYISTHLGFSTSNLHSPGDEYSSFFKEVQTIGETGRARTLRKAYADSKSSNDDSTEDEASDNASDFAERIDPRLRVGSYEDLEQAQQVGNPFDQDQESENLSDKIVESIEQIQLPIPSLKIKLRAMPPKIAAEPDLTSSKKTSSPKRSQRQQDAILDAIADFANVKPGWEVCTQGHPEWEKRRLLDPSMPQIIKNPGPNRVVEYSAKSRSLRSRRRKDGDPPYEQTRGGPILRLRQRMINKSYEGSTFNPYIAASPRVNAARRARLSPLSEDTALESSVECADTESALDSSDDGYVRTSEEVQQ